MEEPHVAKVVRLEPHKHDPVRLAPAWTPAGEGIVATLFSVRPIHGGGWRLQGDEFEPVVFSRGGDAERQARRLAKGVARLGRDAKVNVYDTGDRLVGSIRYYGLAASPGSGTADHYPRAS